MTRMMALAVTYKNTRMLFAPTGLVSCSSSIHKQAGSIDLKISFLEFIIDYYNLDLIRWLLRERCSLLNAGAPKCSPQSCIEQIESF